MCNCDPLLSILTNIFLRFIIYLCSEKLPKAYAFDKKRKCFWCTGDLEFAKSLAEPNLEIAQKATLPESVLKFYDIIDNFIKVYKIVNISQRSPISTSNQNASLHFTLSAEYLNCIECVWRERIEKLGIIRNGTDSFHLAFRNSLESLIDSESIPILTLERDNLLNLQIGLDRVYATDQSIRWILNNRVSTTGFQVNKNHNISIGMAALPLAEDLTRLNLTQFRKLLTGSYLNSVFKKLGYIVDATKFYKLPDDTKFARSIFIISESMCDDSPEKDDNGSSRILVTNVGNVLTCKIKNESKLTKLETIESFFKQRLKSTVQKKMVGTPNQTYATEEPSADQILFSNAALVHLRINYDLLSSCQGTELELESCSDSTLNEHESFLILYNYSRLIAILRKFTQNVESEQYPQIPSIECVDFAKLKHRTELSLVQMLLEWPRELENTVDFYRQEINIASHMKFMKELAYRFNAFYTLIAVLVQPSSRHEFDLMFVRIYLLQAVRQVFEEFLELMLVDYIP